MLLATILLLGAIPQSGQVARAMAKAPAEAVAEAATSGAAWERSLPAMPVAKPEATVGGVSSNVAGGAVQPVRMAAPMQPVKAAYTRPGESRRQRIAWYTLAVTGHGAAAFDAYSTRRVLSGNYGIEANPLLRPFAHSNALYAVTQVSPAVIGVIGKRMMVSENRWVRRLWWLPQAVGSGVSIGAGVHNMRVAH